MNDAGTPKQHIISDVTVTAAINAPWCAAEQIGRNYKDAPVLNCYSGEELRSRRHALFLDSL